MSTSDANTLMNRVQNWVHNNRVLVVVLMLGAVVIGLGQFTDAVDKLRRLVFPGNAAAKAEYCELLAPLIVQLDRTKAAFARWTEQNLSLESEIIRDGNEQARRILMSKAYVVPKQLEDAARRLVEHYDRWFEEFDRVRVRHKDSTEPFVFVGPSGFPFPTDAAERFRARAAELRKILGEENPCK